jgi:hypothetical protein
MAQETGPAPARSDRAYRNSGGITNTSFGRRERLARRFRSRNKAAPPLLLLIVTTGIVAFGLLLNILVERPLLKFPRQLGRVRPPPAQFAITLSQPPHFAKSTLHHERSRDGPPLRTFSRDTQIFRSGR